MKKSRLFSALTLVLMLLLTLSSCGGGAFLGNIDFKYESDPVYTGAVEIANLNGSVIDSGNTLVYLYHTTDSGNKIYTVYNVNTGNVVYSHEIGAVDDRSVEIEVYELGKQDIFTVTTENNYVFETIALYDQNGNLVNLLDKADDLKIICDELVIFDDIVYTLGKKGLEKSVVLDGTFKTLPIGNDTDVINHVSKKYVYAVYENDDSVVVYTKKGDFKYSYTAPSYATSTNISVLNNGKILVQYLKSLPDESDKYDLIRNYTKYDIVTLIIDPADGKVKEKNVDFLIYGVSSAYEINLNDSYFKDSFNGNIAYITPVDKDGFADSNIYKIVELSNDLKVKADFGDAFGYDANFMPGNIVRKGVMAVSDGLGNLIFINKNGKILATLKSSGTSYSENFIVTGNAIYNYSMKPIYDLESNGYTLVANTDKFVILKKDNEYFRFTSETGALAMITNATTGITYEGVSLGMYCIKNGAEYSYIDSTGRTVATFGAKISYSFISENGNTIIKANGKYYNLSV